MLKKYTNEKEVTINDEGPPPSPDHDVPPELDDHAAERRIVGGDVEEAAEGFVILGGRADGDGCGARGKGGGQSDGVKKGERNECMYQNLYSCGSKKFDIVGKE